MSHTINRQCGTELKRLHEVNFSLISQLIPDIDSLDSKASSVVDQGDDLFLQIIQRSPYTTVLSLTHHYTVGPARLPAPDIWVRVSHDAKVAEAIAQQDGSSPAHAKIYTWHKGLDTDIKLKLNTFLEQWLRHCIDQGHTFVSNDLYSEFLSV